MMLNLATAGDQPLVTSCQPVAYADTIHADRRSGTPIALPCQCANQARRSAAVV